MDQENAYHYGILYMIHLIIAADDVIDAGELKALETVIKTEGMDADIYRKFIDETAEMSEKEIFHKGIDIISSCSREQMIRAFAWLMKISESDGHVHVKEIRFLLYSVKKAGIGFNEVVAESKALPSLP